MESLFWLKEMVEMGKSSVLVVVEEIESKEETRDGGVILIKKVWIN